MLSHDLEHRHPPERPLRRIKCTVVGDGAVGKTSLLISYSTNTFPTEYVPTIFDNWTTKVMVDGQVVALDLWDTAGQEDLDALRPLAYPSTDVFLVAFSVASAASARNVQQRWVPELRRGYRYVPILLVGLQTDRRDDAVAPGPGQHVESAEMMHTVQGMRLAKDTGAIGYYECCALTLDGVKEVFDQVIRVALDPPASASTTCLAYPAIISTVVALACLSAAGYGAATLPLTALPVLVELALRLAPPLLLFIAAAATAIVLWRTQHVPGSSGPQHHLGPQHDLVDDRPSGLRAWLVLTVAALLTLALLVSLASVMLSLAVLGVTPFPLILRSAGAGAILTPDGCGGAACVSAIIMAAGYGLSCMLLLLALGYLIHKHGRQAGDRDASF